MIRPTFSTKNATQWAIKRSIGKKKWIWTRGVLAFGAYLFVLMLAIRVYRHGTAALNVGDIVGNLIGALVGGYIYGRFMWSYLESSYAKYIKTEPNKSAQTTAMTPPPSATRVAPLSDL
jgi:hypothetical protein